jgi:hypothetical protein
MHANAIAANTPTTSAGAAEALVVRTGAAGVQARHPRIHPAIPFAMSNAAPSPARPP